MSSDDSLRQSLRDTSKREKALLQRRLAGQRMRRIRELWAALTGVSLVTAGVSLALLTRFVTH